MKLLKVRINNQPNRALYYALPLSGIILAGLLYILLPDTDFIIFIAAWVTVFVPVSVIAYNIGNQEYFNILNIYSLIFLLEGFGGALAGGMKMTFNGHRQISEPLLFQSLAIYFTGYLLFISGFYMYRGIASFFKSRESLRLKAQQKIKALPVHLTKSQWHRLLLILPVFIGLGFVKLASKIRAAGGFTEYIYSMYQYRYGTFAENISENAWVSLANLLDNLALPLSMLGLAAWFSRRLPTLFRNILFLLLSVVVFQKFTSGFRSTTFFTILSIIMVYDSVRPLKMARLLILTAMLTVFLFGINFIHHYLYFLTAGYSKQTLLESLATLLAPQDHLANLSCVLTAASINPPLEGEGLLESVFFFIPRLLWHSKTDSYGTIIVQQWAYMPDWYQMAITSVGELIAHFGYMGIPVMVVVGAAHGWLERFHQSVNPVMRMGYFCMVLPRLLAHLGMGVSAVSITLFSMALLYSASIFLGFTRKVTWDWREYGMVGTGSIRATRRKGNAFWV